jgi:PRC-barrel domain
MMTQDQLANLQGTTVYDRNGDKIGSVGQVYTAGDPDQPLWASVNMGLFGTRETLVPLADAEMRDRGEMHVPYDKDFVKDAPNVDVGVAEPVSIEDAERLYQHYQTGSYATGRAHAEEALGQQEYGRVDTERLHRYVARDQRASGDVGREDF